MKSLDGLEFKSFKKIYLSDNPIYPIVEYWINGNSREELIEYFVDMNIIQEGEVKPKLILPRLKTFYNDIEELSNINIEAKLASISIHYHLKEHYEIIK